MIAKCASCQYVFTTDRYGRQFCPSCGAELVLPAPAGAQPPPPAGAPGPAEPPPSAAPPQEPPPGQPSATPQAPAPGTARCAMHPDRPASSVCSRCGTFACAECLQTGTDGQPQCLACRGREGSAEPTPWEEREKLGLAKAYFETVKRSIVEPVRLFERMRVDNAEGALSYFWITFGLASLIGQAWQALFSKAGLSSLFGGGGKLPEGNPLAAWSATADSPLFHLAMGIGFALAAPVFLYIYAGLFHLGLMLFKGARNGFNATLRSVAYASGPYLLQLVPLCGGVVGGIWVLVLYVIGLSRTQRTTTGVAIGAVLVPLLVLTCCACGLLGVVASLASIAAAGAMQQFGP